MYLQIIRDGATVSDRLRARARMWWMAALDFHPARLSASRSSGMLAGLCMALLLLCGTAQVAHSHAGDDLGQEIHSSCSLCVSAHVGVQVSVLPTVARGTPIVGRMAVLPAAIPVDPQEDALPSIRPPPVVLTLA